MPKTPLIVQGAVAERLQHYNPVWYLSSWPKWLPAGTEAPGWRAVGGPASQTAVAAAWLSGRTDVELPESEDWG